MSGRTVSLIGPGPRLAYRAVWLLVMYQGVSSVLQEGYPKHGAIIEDMGNLILPKYAAMVVIDLRVMSTFVPRLGDAHLKVLEFQKILAEPKNTMWLDILGDKLDLVEKEISKLVVNHKETFEDSKRSFQRSSRSKRWALFPFVGSAMKTLFGTATSSQVHLYEKHLSNLNVLVQNNSLVIQHNLHSIAKQTTVINELVDDVHVLVNNWRNVSDRTTEVKYSLSLLANAQQIYDMCLYLSSSLKDILRAIVQLAKLVKGP